tara:strand:- start:586 stop:1113 length:528 start_codon:yes stop_codon:yes gene_type:complete
MATLFVDKIDPQSGTSLEIGSSGDTITVPSGVTVAGGLTNTPSFSAQLLNTQSIADNTTVTIIFDQENHDTDNAYNTSTGEFTVPSGKGGKYFFTTHFRLNSTSDSSRLSSFIQVNGSTKATYNNVQRDEDSSGVSLVIDLNAGDEVKVGIFQNTGAAKNSKTADNVMFMGFKLI